MADAELLPCPFCGAGKTEIREDRPWLGQRYGEPISVSVRHWCEPIEGQPVRMIERVGRDRAAAVAAWNRRAAARGAEIEALREALTALKAENETLREALKDADNELDWLDEEIDTCDHSVGVCTCSYWDMRRKMKAALAKESSND